MELGGVEGDQIGVADPLGIELPACCDQPPHLRAGQASLRRRQAATGYWHQVGFGVKADFASGSAVKDL